MTEKNVKVICGVTVERVEPDKVHLSNNTYISYDLVIWATGAAPLPLLKHIDVERDSEGYMKVISIALNLITLNMVKVKQTLQSVSSPFIFGAGDCVSIEGCPYVTKAGVYAVREGPFLIQNILQMIKQNPKMQLESSSVSLSEYVPQRGFLSLLCTGDGGAISSWKGTCSKGYLMWKLKDGIDRGFMEKFTKKENNTPKQSNSRNCIIS
jgi:NADH dehydrogenase FAD-containing subunit